MNCETLDNLLLDLLYDELDGDTKIEAQTHLTSCEGCQLKLAAMGGVRRVFQAMPEPEMPTLSYQALLAEADTAANNYSQASAPLKNQAEPQALWSKLSAAMRFLWSPPVAVAAGVVLVLGVSLSLNPLNPANSSFASHDTMTLADEPMMLAQNKPSPETTLMPASLAIPYTASEGGLVQDSLTNSKKGRVLPTEAKSSLSLSEATPAMAAPIVKSEAPSDDRGFGGPGDEVPVKLSPPLKPIASGSFSSTVDAAGASQKKADSVGYQQSISNGNNAYKNGDLEEAEKQYQTAVDKALFGSKEQDIALAAQAQTQAASKDCDSSLESARMISTQGKGMALLAAADCYNTAGDSEKAKDLYNEISLQGGAPGAEAKRSLLALETKLSKSILEETKANKLPKKPTKNTTKPPVADPPQTQK
jgi:hypothetical protein